MVAIMEKFDPALDGLRAIAVGAVIVGHSAAKYIAGG